MTSVVIALFITIYIVAHDCTFTHIRLFLSQLSKGRVWKPYAFFSARDSQGLSTVINTRYVFFSLKITSSYIQCGIYPEHAKNPTIYNLRSFQRNNGSRNFVISKRLRGTRLSLSTISNAIVNIPFSGLRGSQPESAPLWCCLSGTHRNAQVFLPRRYSVVMTDDEIEKINTKVVSLNLVYRGVCEETKACLLAIEM
jgi:hypothetical protein